MILQEIQNLDETPHDICVIGCGAIGIALAVTLGGSGRRVLLLEAGGDNITEESQEYYRCASVGHPHTGASHGRFRVFGGSTERWGGQAMRFEPVDLEARPWMNARAWPLSFDAMIPYYRQAERFMGVDEHPYDRLEGDLQAFARKLGVDLSELSRHLLPFKLQNTVFALQPRLRECYSSTLHASPDIVVAKDVTATRLITDGAGTVTGLSCQHADRTVTVRARQFVLATGGIENARFLLLQKERFGIPELAAHRAIGLFFQDHPGAHVAEISGLGAALFQNVFRMKRGPRMSYKGRITWSDEKRRNDHLHSASATFLMSRRPSEFDDAPDPGGAPVDPAEWRLALRLLCRGILYSPLHYTVLAVSGEDAPDRRSRILLSDKDVDPLGLPSPVMDWHISPGAAESIVEFTDHIERLYATMKLGRFRRFAFSRDASLLMPHLADNAHHVGSTSIGATPDHGVVDANLNVHGFQNFQVAGTSVLPTASHANPTLTALALTFRLAEQMRARV